MQAKTAKSERPARAKRKLTRAERKQIEAVVRQAKGDGKAHTVQDSIPFHNIFPDGLCRLDERTFSKTISYEDVNYRLASPEDQRDIFEHLCDFYNGYDPSIGVQMTLSSRYVEHGPEEDLFGIHPQGDDLDPIREDAAGILRFQYERGSNGYVKTKYVTLTIEAENLAAARARFARIETDTLTASRSWAPPPMCWTGGNGWNFCMASSTRRAGGLPSIGTGWRPAGCRSRTSSPRPPSSSGRPVPSALVRCTAR